MQRRWLIFWVLAGSYFFVMFHRFCTAVMAGDLSTDLGLDPAALGFLSSMYLLGYASVQIPVGILSDWWGARKTISLFLLMASFGAFAFGKADSFETAVLARWLVGAGVGCVYVPALRLMGCWFEKDSFAFMTGMMLAVGNLGALSSTWPLAVIKGIWGWRATMEVVSLITLVLVALVWLLVKDQPEENEKVSNQQAVISENPKNSAEKPAMPAQPQGFRMMFKSRRFWALTVYFFAFETTIISFQGLWAGPFLKRVYNFKDTSVGYALTWLALGLMIGAILSGMLAGRSLRRRHAVLTVGMLGYLACWVPMVFTTASIESYLIPLLAIMGICGGFFSISFGIAKECFGPAMAGTALGVYNFTGFVGGGLGMWITGLIIRGLSPHGTNEIAAFRTAFGLNLGIMLIGWIMLILLPRAWANQAVGEDSAEGS
ncbi:MAG: MFS transporter [Candidatus Riflebacteria bacterium]|nr:MFS transporter [Candidatus Riflebacteria bacterium]